MIIGIGVDVCDIGRVRRSLERHGERLMDKVLGPDEKRYCLARHDVATSFAGRFAAKEAAIKALRSPVGLRWQDITVLPAQGGPPQLSFVGVAAQFCERHGVVACHLSISHDAGVAIAMVTLEAA